MVVFTSKVVKMKEHLSFSSEFNTKVELLLIVFSNFDREAALIDSAF